MKIPFYDLIPLHQSMRQALDDAYHRVLNRSNYILGPELEQFEQAFAKYCGTKYCIGVGNGLEAISLALRAFGISHGDEVLVPSHTFIASWLGVTQIGATPIPIEPDPKTYNMDPNRLEDAITPRTRAILPVHLYGQPADMNSIMEVASRHNLIVIEDAAQAHGAAINGKRAGSFGHAAAFSFYPTKNLGALGDGGAITTSDPGIKDRLALLRNYGSKKKYEHLEAAGNSRLDELQAAFLFEKLKFLDSWNETRQGIAARYSSELQNVKGITVPYIPNWASPVWHQYVISCSDRDRLTNRLAKREIGSMVHYPIPPHLQEAYKTLGYKKGDFPIAEKLSSTVISLPIWDGMNDQMIQAVVEACREN